jgi:hypothetical protein
MVTAATTLAALTALAVALTANSPATATPAPNRAATPDRASSPAAARAAAGPAAGLRVLFDDTLAETAGNADWIISTSRPDPLGQNPAPATEKDWTGALSSWGVALQRTGRYTPLTLPPGNTITYHQAGNALDLSTMSALVLPEPNVRLSSAEKTAVLNFVHDGGGLFLISDHTGSDRNNDGWDSPKIINDLLTSNGVDNTDPFGFSVDLLNISRDNPVAAPGAPAPIVAGAFGTVAHGLIANGTTVTLKPADNPAVVGVLRRSTAATDATGANFAVSTFGTGRVAFWGDSSPIDDGTGQSGNSLHDGWNDPTADDAALALNTTAWLVHDGS